MKTSTCNPYIKPEKNKFSIFSFRPISHISTLSKVLENGKRTKNSQNNNVASAKLIQFMMS